MVDLAPHLDRRAHGRSGGRQVSRDTRQGAGRGARRKGRRSRGIAGRIGRRHAGRRDPAHARFRGRRHPLDRHVRIRSAHRHRRHAGCRAGCCAWATTSRGCASSWPTCMPRRGWCAPPRISLGGGDLQVQDWTNEHVNFFRSIAITKRILFVILSLMVAVAAFNIVSTMVMVVKDKRRDIAIMRTFGASPRQYFVGIRGAGQPDRPARHRRSACCSGVLVAANLQELVHGLESIVGFKFLDARVYFMSDLPARVRVSRRGANLRLRLCACVRFHAVSRRRAPRACCPQSPCETIEDGPDDVECKRLGARRKRTRQGLRPGRGENRRCCGGAPSAFGPASALPSSARRDPVRPRYCSCWAGSICRPAARWKSTERR